MSSRCESPNKNKLIRQCQVKFGNPALGIYSGTVYTIPNDNDCHDGCHAISTDEVVDFTPIEIYKCTEEEDARCKRVVAMVGVPPEQVPEDLLNFARSHAKHIRHVRILISPPRNTTTGTTSSSSSSSGPDTNKTSSIQYAAGESKQSSSVLHLDAPSSNTSLLPSNRNITDNLTINTAISLSPLPAADTSSKMLAEGGSTMYNGGGSENNIATSEEKNSESTNAEDCENQIKLLRTKHLLLEQEQEQDDRQTYLVLFEMDSSESADEFIADLHGKPFTFLQDNVLCKAFRAVAPLYGDGEISLISPFFALGNTSTNNEVSQSPPASTRSPLPSPSNHATITSSYVNNHHLHRQCTASTSSPSEMQNCAVCLELLDYTSCSSPPILTTVCNHTFHVDCLRQWQDSPCPVCRYDHSGLNETLSVCHVCGTTEHNFVCLICGVISCGGSGSAAAGRTNTSAATLTNADNNTIFGPQQHQQHDSHARAHYAETLHAYALEISTQHVWDFAGDGFVHRLIHNIDDNKIVEINDPMNNESNERSLSPGMTDAQEGEVVHRKLECFASEYNDLLKGQLEQQRIHYESQLEEIKSNYRRKNVESTSGLISALKQEQNHLEQQCMSLRRKYQKIGKESDFLVHMNESLEANKPAMRRQLMQVKIEKQLARDMISKSLPSLEEKVKILMLQLESGYSDNTGTTTHDMKPASKR